MKTFYIKTLGCKVNSYESEFVRNLLLNEGYEEVEENADMQVVPLEEALLVNDAKVRHSLMVSVIR